MKTLISITRMNGFWKAKIKYLWHCKGMWEECNGGRKGCILQLNRVKWLTLTFSGVPFFSGIHIVRLTVDTKDSILLLILSNGASVWSKFLGGRGGGWGGGGSDRCLKWGGGGVIKGSLQKHLKIGVGKGKSCL